VARAAARPARATGKDAAGASRRRAEIVAIARELFAEKGYAATSIRDIAEASGLLAGSLYSHFRSKAEILAIVIDPFSDRLLAEQAEVLAQGGTGRDRLEEMIERVLALCLEHRTEVRILHYEWPRLHPNAELADMVRASARTLEMWREVFVAGVDDGSLRADLDPDVATRMVTSSLHAVTDIQRFQNAATFPDERGLRWLTQQVLASVVVGVANPNGVAS
jgi:TetR/AcrR family transcriptional regulator, cholesterol catabolism regulator